MNDETATLRLNMAEARIAELEQALVAFMHDFYNTGGPSVDMAIQEFLLKIDPPVLEPPIAKHGGR